MIESLKNYVYKSVDNSFMSKIFYPGWKYMVNLIPSSIHPNTITLAGLLINIIGYNYAEYTPLGGFIFGLSMLTYMNFDAIDGMHARNTNTGSILGEFIDHMSDGISQSIMVAGFLKCVNSYNNISKNILMSLVSNSFLTSQIDAMSTGYITFEKFSDTSLIIPLISLFCIVCPLFNITINFTYEICSLVYILSCYLYYDKAKRLDRDNKTLLFAYLLIKTIIVYTTMDNAPYFIDQNILYETIICKMTKSTINSYVLLIPLTYKIFPDYTNIFGVACSVYYIWKISTILNIPVFTKKKRIYCCGVFDLLHLGHIELFKKCSKYADEVLVGIHNDEDVKSYKRTPFFNENIRYQMVSNLNYVTKVIPDAPLYTTKKFLQENNIDLVAIGEEYENIDDKWYEEVRKTTKYVVIPRYQGLSSSDILKNTENLYF